MLKYLYTLTRTHTHTQTDRQTHLYSSIVCAINIDYISSLACDTTNTHTHTRAPTINHNKFFIFVDSRVDFNIKGRLSIEREPPPN